MCRPHHSIPHSFLQLCPSMSSVSDSRGLGIKGSLARPRQQAVDMVGALQLRMVPGEGGLTGWGRSWEPRGTEQRTGLC